MFLRYFLDFPNSLLVYYSVHEFPEDDGIEFYDVDMNFSVYKCNST